MQDQSTTRHPYVWLICPQCGAHFRRIYRDYARSADGIRCCSKPCRKAYIRAQHPPCVYAIVHVPSGRLYVGSTAAPHERWRNHRGELTHGRHANAPLQAAWTESSPDAWEFRYLEVVPDATQLIAREQTWLDHYRATGLLFNRQPNAGTATGTVMPPSFSAMLSARQRGRHLSPEARAKIAAKARGRKWPAGRLPPVLHFTPTEVQAIRIRWANGETQQALASEFGVSRGAIGGIAIGRRYQHVPMDDDTAARVMARRIAVGKPPKPH